MLDSFEMYSDCSNVPVGKTINDIKYEKVFWREGVRFVEEILLQTGQLQKRKLPDLSFSIESHVSLR